VNQGAPVPRDDEQRLRAVAELGLADAAQRPGLERLARLAAQLAGTPIACVAIVERQTVWTAATHGVAPVVVERTNAFGAHAILATGLWEVEDAARDRRFAGHPWVAGAPFVRFCAAAPLAVAGHAVGALVVLDTVARPRLADAEREALLDLAAAAAEAWSARLELATARAEIERLATHDVLTGALNRRGLTERLATALSLARRSGATLTVTLLDLDDFADLNERFGLAVGDEALRAVARRLLGAVREHDLVARTGGDEFAVVLQATDEASAVIVAARLLADLARVHRIGGFALELRASAGVATFPRDAEDLTGLLRAADVALARAQAAGGGAMAYVPDPV
jgi:diguanylate cyclase (GGDEF)-like protein